MLEKFYVYCHDCNKLVAVCCNVDIASSVSNAYFKTTNSAFSGDYCVSFLVNHYPGREAYSVSRIDAFTPHQIYSECDCRSWAMSP